MTFSTDDTVIAELGVSPARQYLFLGALVGLGVLIIWQTMNSEAALVPRALLFVLGIALLFQANKLRMAPKVKLLLTEAGLYQSDGELVADWDQIQSIDRGALAIKPSNGFTLLLKEKHQRAWVPGLWWRLGRRIGVGGTAYAGSAKFMAEQIALRLKQSL